MQLVKDLLTHYDTIFTPETNEINAEHEKRRLEAPVALHVDAGKDAETLSGPISPGGIRRGFMSLVRSATPDDTPKRQASGVFGAFNRSAYSESTTTRSPGNKFTTSIAVSSPPGDNTPDAFIIADEQSMTSKPEQETEEPDVMFDASEDHDHDNESQGINKTTKTSADKSKPETQGEGDVGEADKAEKHVYSNNLIAEMSELAPSDKEGNDIDPFFEDD